MVFDPSNDWEIMDGLESIQFYSRSSEDEYATPVGAFALKREDQKGTASGNEYTSVSAHAVPWEVWRTSFNTPLVPKVGDKLKTADNVEFLVVAADYSTLSTRYRLHCEEIGQGS